jgi:tripartite-type tricarboxylate transporter receptor subunit TctC
MAMAASVAFVYRFLAALVGLAAIAPALAQESFPAARPIEFVVLFPAGSSADVTARVLAEGMSRQLGTQIVVVNRPGGGGAVGLKYAVQQAPDGHHMVWSSNAISTTYHTGMLPFDYRSFLPVARVQIETPLLFVKGEASWRSLRDVLQHAKANPGKLTVGNSGFGSHTHLSSVWLFKVAGYQVTDVPFNAAQVVPSLLGGHVDAVVQLPGALAGLVKAGTVRALVALSGARDPFFPDVPTAREQGMSVGAELWRGVAVPKGTPPRIVARLEDAIRKAVASPEFVRATEKLLVSPAFLPAGEFGKAIAKEDAEIGKTVKALGIRQDSK